MLIRLLRFAVGLRVKRPGGQKVTCLLRPQPWLDRQLRSLGTTSGYVPKITKTSGNQLNSEIIVEFENGKDQGFFHVWLRDSCRCPLCFNENVQLRHSNSWVPELDLQPRSFHVTGNGDLDVVWPGREGDPDHRSLYSGQWLWECREKMSEGLKCVPRDVQRPAVNLWSELAELPTVQYSDYMESETGLSRWLELFHQYGFVILKGVPESGTEDIPARFSFIRETCFGRTSEVFVGPHADEHPGYTGDAIQLHTDLTYMERSPGTLNLHCIRSADPETFGADAGGQTMLADGTAAALWLRKSSPDQFQLLTDIRLPYSYRMPSTGYLYTSDWPVVTLDPRGGVKEIHFSNFARRVLTIKPELVLPVYQAIKSFANRLNETKTAFYLRPGDVLSINNRRVLHARTSFDPKKAHRHLRTFYMDLDEVYGCYDVINGKKNEH